MASAIVLLVSGCGQEDSLAPSGSAGSAGAGVSTGGATGGTAGSGTGEGGAGSGGVAGGMIGGCFQPGERPSTVGPHGFHMPDLNAERATYKKFGWTWDAGAEPDYPEESGYSVSNPDIHHDTEGDDLWTYLMMYQRTNQRGYLDRANAWARYFKEDFASCVGSKSATHCYDRTAFGACHTWGWGLIALYEINGDQRALEAAEQIGTLLEELYGPNTTHGCLPVNACTQYGVRGAGRHLLLATRLAEVTGKQRWNNLRDKVLDLILNSSSWDAQRGMYFIGEFATDKRLWKGAYAAGARVAISFHIGWLTEAFDHAYRTTGREELRDRMVKIAEFVKAHGLDPTYDYNGQVFGIVDGQSWNRYGSASPVTYWDPVYTTSLVNTLMRGYRYTCDSSFLESAKHYFERGNRGLHGEPTKTATPDGVIHHFVDTKFSSSSGFFYLKYNKGELQYTYLLFED